jgi:26S proteasome regulatory subunit N10
MPETTLLCIDTSDYMRNGDYYPNRMIATIETANLLVCSKIEQNPENTVGLLAMGGKKCNMCETPTQNIDKIMLSIFAIGNCKIGGKMQFANSLQIANMGLSHFSLNSTRRIIMFLGSPVNESLEKLEKIAKTLRKNDIAIDIIALGVQENKPLLKKFINIASKNNNSHFLYIEPKSDVVSTVLNSVIVNENLKDLELDSNKYDSGDELELAIRMSQNI